MEEEISLDPQQYIHLGVLVDLEVIWMYGVKLGSIRIHVALVNKLDDSGASDLRAEKFELQ